MFKCTSASAAFERYERYGAILTFLGILKGNWKRGALGTPWSAFEPFFESKYAGPRCIYISHLFHQTGQHCTNTQMARYLASMPSRANGFDPVSKNFKLESQTRVRRRQLCLLSKSRCKKERQSCCRKRSFYRFLLSPCLDFLFPFIGSTYLASPRRCATST